MAVPAADAALLAAQAKAGQAGLDAYEAAKAELTSQRQQAAQQAMQEAALRGGPAEAAQSQQSIITAPYDTRIASLTQGGAAYAADMSARDRRLADYNAAVGAARSFIPEQTAQQVAPINARGEYEVRGIERTGEGKVLAIDAQRRLVEAQMAAAALAAAGKGGGGGGGRGGGGGGGGGGKKDKLNKTELESQLFNRAKARVQQSVGAARSAIATNQGKVKAATKVATKAVRGGDTGVDARNRAASNARSNQAMAARYMAQGAADYARKQQADQRAAAEAPKRGGANITATFKPGLFGPTTAPPPLSTLNRQPVTPARSPVTPARTPNATDITATFKPGLFGPGRPTTPGRTPNTEAPFGRGLGGGRGGGGLSASFKPGLFTRGQRAETADDVARQVAALQQNITTGLAQQGRREYDAARQIASTTGRTERDLSVESPTSGRRVLLTPEQLSMFNEFDQDALLRAPRGLMSTGDVDTQLLGAPGDRGIGDPYSSEVMRNAMVQSAQEMQDEGYDITESEVLNALGEAEQYKSGTSLYDALARQSGQPTGEEEFSISQQVANEDRRARSEAESAADDEASLLEDQADQNDAVALAAFRNKYQMPPPSKWGTPTEAWAAVSSPEFQEAEEALFSIQEHRGVSGIDDDIEDALYDLNVRSPGTIQMLKDLYS